MNQPLTRSYSIQKGAVLAITLLLLLVVTVVGVAGMSSSSIQVFLARNTQLKNISFQNAESSVLIGEQTLNGALATCLGNQNCTTDDLEPSHSVPIDWGAISGDGVTGYGKYALQYLGWRPVPGESDKVVRLYRVSARGQGPTTKAQTQIQTMFRKCAKTDFLPCPG
jgi:type IV pilus assembly protein PilX